MDSITENVVRIKRGIDKLKSFAYNWALLGDIPISIINIAADDIFRELKEIEDYLNKQILDLELDIEVQK